MISLTEREQINNYVIDEYRNLIENLRYYIHGYSVFSLEKVLPSDIPVILVAGSLNEYELSTLRKVRKRSCIIALGTGWKQLCENGVFPDFLVVGKDTEETDFIENESINEIPMITCTSVNSVILHSHTGMKFFYWTGNELERELYVRAKQYSSFVYKYDELIRLTESNDLRDISVKLSLHIGASEIVLVGNGFENYASLRELDNDVRILNTTYNDKISIEIIKNKCRVEYNLMSIINSIIPLFDECGKKVFWTRIDEIKSQLRVIEKTAQKSIELYNILYDFSRQQVVYREDIDYIINQLNLNTAKMEENNFIDSILELSRNFAPAVMNEKEKNIVDNSNQLAETAVNGIIEYEKIQIISNEMANLLVCIKERDIYHTVKTDNKMEYFPSILICHPISNYDVLTYFTQELKKGFQQLKYNTYYMNELSHYQKTVGYDYVLLMNGIFMTSAYKDSVLSHEKYVFDHKRTTLIALFVDHPITHKKRLDCGRKHIKALFADRNWQKFIHNFRQEIKYAYFLPLGGIEQEEIMPFLFKENKIVFFGSYRQLDEIESEINTKANAELIWTIINYLKNHVTKTIEEAIEVIGTERNCVCSLENILLLTDLFFYIDEYIRQYFRQKVVWKIAEAGLPIDLYGWKDEKIKIHPNVQIKDPVMLDQMLDICRHTRFVLNVQPWTKDGTQERVFNAMLGGSIAITDESKYLLEECIDERHLLFYKLDLLDSLIDKLSYYMQNESEALSLAEQGYQLAKEKHTWEKRTVDMVKLLDMPMNIN